MRDKLMNKTSKDIDLVLLDNLFDKFECKLLELPNCPVKRFEKIAQNKDVLRFDLGELTFDVRGIEGSPDINLQQDV